MAEHTPTPWKASGNGIHKGIRCVATTDYIDRRSGEEFKEACANAEFIVRACNAHDDLLAACEAICGVFEGQEDAPLYVLKARAAIAKASLP